MKSAYIVIASTLVVAACAPPFPGTITELGASDPDTGLSGASDVSDTGRIVGYVGGLNEKAAEFAEAGTVLRMPTPSGYGACRAVAIANDGRIAGTCRVRTNERSTAFFAASIQAPPVFITPQDGVLSTALDMNEHGVILGVKNTPGADDQTPWLYDTATETLRELPGLPGKFMSAVAINDAGDIVGSAAVLSSDGIRWVYEGVKWSGDSLTITSLPLVPADINNRGDIVGGNLYLPAGATTPRTLPEPALGPGRLFAFAEATDLNDDGFIVGRGDFTYIANDTTTPFGLVWPPEGGVLELGVNTRPYAVNASGVIVGIRAGKAVRIELPAASR